MTQHFSDSSQGCGNPDMYRVYGQYELITDIPVDTGAMGKYIFGTGHIYIAYMHIIFNVRVQYISYQTLQFCLHKNTTKKIYKC